MSLYNMVNGFNPACVLLMPMLGRKEEDYPRFRDCFVSEDGQNIVIYTRVGGGNRDCGFGEEELYEDENFIRTWDDEFDSTYGYYEFSVPEQWKNDFDLILMGKLQEVSNEYRNYLKEFFPILAENGLIDQLLDSNKEG